MSSHMVMSDSIARIGSAMFAVISCAALAGCSDSTKVAGIDAGGTPLGKALTVGTVTGLGGVTVGGTDFDVSGATITIDGVAASQVDLRLGQIVAVEYEQGGTVADSVDSEDLVEGRIASVDLAASTVSLLGQTVRIAGDTLFDGTGLAAPTDLAANMVVEVSGYALANGEISATRIEARAVSNDYEVTGRVQNVDTVMRRFQINALTVDYAGATLSNISGDPTAGDLVEVKGDVIDGSGVAMAATVEMKSAVPAGEFESFEIEGLITRFVSTTDFDVQGVPVTTTAATQFTNGSATDLELNRKIEVEGGVNSTGTLVADSVEIRATSTAKIQAFVDTVDSAQNLLEVLTIPVIPTAATQFKDEGPLELREFSLADINAGDFLIVVGQEDGESVTATLIKRTSPEDRPKLEGTATDLAQPELRVIGVTVLTNGQTDFEGSGGVSIDAATFFATAAGRTVEVEGDRSGDTLLAREIELED